MAAINYLKNLLYRSIDLPILGNVGFTSILVTAFKEGGGVATARKGK